VKKIFVFLILSLLIVHAGNIWAVEVDVLGGVDIHGFISQGYLKSSDNNYLTNDSEDGSFSFNEVGINFSKEIKDNLHVGLQFFSRDLGDVANNKVTLDWAFADYRWRDWLGLRAGKIRLPQGLFNETRDLDMLRTCILLPQGIYNDLLRDTFVAFNGVALYGDVPLYNFGNLNYQLILGQMDPDEESGIEKALNSQLNGLAFLNGELDVDSLYGIDLEWRTPLNGLTLKANYAETAMDVPAITPLGTSLTIEEPTIEATIFSLQYNWEDLMLAAEYRTFKQIMEIDLYGISKTLESESYYVMATYRFTDWLEVGTYYSVIYPDKDDKDGDNLAIDYMAWQKDAALSFRFDINEYWVFKLEGHLIDGAASTIMVDNPGGVEEDWYMVASKLSFSF